MKLNDTLKDINEAIEMLQMIDDAEYVAANGLSEEEINQFKKDLDETIKKDKENIQQIAWYVIHKRQDAEMMVNGAKAEIARLQDVVSSHESRVKKADRTLLWIMQTLYYADIEKNGKAKLITPLATINYTKSDKMKVEDHGITELPHFLTKWTVSAEVDPSKKDQLMELGFEPTLQTTSLTDVKKRYKDLSPEDQEKLKGKGIYIDDTPSIKIKGAKSDKE